MNLPLTKAQLCPRTDCHSRQTEEMEQSCDAARTHQRHSFKMQLRSVAAKRDAGGCQGVGEIEPLFLFPACLVLLCSTHRLGWCILLLFHPCSLLYWKEGPVWLPSYLQERRNPLQRADSVAQQQRDLRAPPCLDGKTWSEHCSPGRRVQFMW